MSEKFVTGTLVMTAAVAELGAANESFAHFVRKSLQRHTAGDWGDLSAEDVAANEYALGKPLRLFSAYEHSGHPKIWIITEADRSVTTVLYPEDY